MLTNAHNVRGDHGDGHVRRRAHRRGHRRRADIDGDLAVISVDTGETPALPWADGAAAEIGTPVFALANPGGRGLRVTFGFVSGIERTFRGPRGRRITGSLEHTAPLLPGSSGGPVLDAAGQLLAINTNRLGDGFYLAIPADEALRGRADALARGEISDRRRGSASPSRPDHVARRLRRAVGLPDTDGLLIREVADDSPAARAGLAHGDLIVAAAGQPVRTPDDLFDALQAARRRHPRAHGRPRHRRADHPGHLHRARPERMKRLQPYPRQYRARETMPKYRGPGRQSSTGASRPGWNREGWAGSGPSG